MKTKEAIEALRLGKRLIRISSDPPVDLCDHLGECGFQGYFQLCQQDKVIRVVTDAPCAGTVKRVMDLETFASRNVYSYINFAEYEKPA